MSGKLLQEGVTSLENTFFGKPSYSSKLSILEFYTRSQFVKLQTVASSAAMELHLLLCCGNKNTFGSEQCRFTFQIESTMKTFLLVAWQLLGEEC